MKLFISFLCLITKLTPAFASESFNYSVRVPAEPNLSCTEQSQKVASRLIAATAAKLVAPPTCLESLYKEGLNSFILRSIKFQYTWTTSVPNGRFYRAEYSSSTLGGEPSGEEGLYVSYQTCLNDLSSRQLEYTQHTGLQVISSGCYPATMGEQFALRIEGFGQPKAHLLMLRLFSSIGKSSDLIDQIALVLKQANATPVAKLEEGILYYSATELFSQDVELNNLANENECLLQKTTLEKFYKKNDSAYGPSSCVSFTVLGQVFFALRGIGVGNIDLMSNDYKDEDYFSFNECFKVANEKNAKAPSETSYFCRMTDRPVGTSYQNESYRLVEMTFIQ